MNGGEIILYGTRLFLGGVSAFLVILYCSKNRSAFAVSLTASVLTEYAATVYMLLCDLGIFMKDAVLAFGHPLLPILAFLVPPLFLILALIFLIARER